MDCFTFKAFDFRTASWAYFRHLKLEGVPYTFFNEDTCHFGNDIPSSSYYYGIPNTHVFGPNLVDVMQRSITYRGSTNKHRFKPCNWR